MQTAKNSAAVAASMYRGQPLASYGMEEALLLLRQPWSLSIPEEGPEEGRILVVVVVASFCCCCFLTSLEESLEEGLEEADIVAVDVAECLLGQSSLAGDPVGVGTGYCYCVQSSREEGQEEVYTC